MRHFLDSKVGSRGFAVAGAQSPSGCRSVWTTSGFGLNGLAGREISSMNAGIA